MATRPLPLLAILLILLVTGAAPAAASSMEDFGSCLTKSGATYYGASWCPVCRRQTATLGEAMRRVRYVECADPSDPERTASECRDADVHSYPTWVFGNRTRAKGGLSLASLARRSGCPLPDGVRDEAPGRASASGAPAPANRANPPPPRGHVKIIEIPQR
jgi:hypothetical protein